MFLEELFEMPIAYDVGLDIKVTRQGKQRKGVKQLRKREIETIAISSKELAEISGEAIMKVFKGISYE